MKHRLLQTALLMMATVACAMMAACADEETSLGMNLMDEGMIYAGHRDTLTVGQAWSVRDDSLMTSNYSFGIIGNYSDATFGREHACLYTQIALNANNNSINFDQQTIDSVVLSLATRSRYPDSTATYRFHFEVMQLAEPLLSDTNYYATDTLAVNPSVVLFDDEVVLTPADTVVRLRLADEMMQILRRNASAEEFIELTKGLRVRITEAADEGMVALDFTRTNDSRILVYYHTYESDTASSIYDFLLGSAAHFIHFSHEYAGSTVGGGDTLDGSQTLYLEPMAGYNVLLNFNEAVQAFLAQHPYATIHYAELLLPVDHTLTTPLPERVMALRKNPGGSDTYINDLLDAYSLAGFDGKYDATRQCYRLRVTQHVQSLLRQGYDPGTLLVLDARRSSANRVLLAGSHAATPTRIELVYTE